MKDKYTKTVSVQWVDSSSMSGWTFEGDALELNPSIIETYGFLIAETEDYITVSATLGQHMVDAPISIPKRCINCLRVDDGIGVMSKTNED